MTAMPRAAHLDLVCMGGGLAGLTAALRAAQFGLRVAVVEAGRGEHYACNSRVAGGILHAAYQDVTLPADELLDGMRRAGVGDDAQARAIAAHAGRALDWLRVQGVRFAHFPHLKRGAWVMAPPRAMACGMEGGAAWRGRGPDLALRTLRQRLRAAGGQFFEGTRGVRLLMEGGRCAGLVVSEAGDADADAGARPLHARAVVLADGGFSGNASLFRAHIGPAPERVLQRGAGTGLGDGLRMALAVGAASSALGRFYGHLLSRDAFTNENLWPFPQCDALAAAGIVVGPDGRRLFDEGLGGIHAANHLATLALPDASIAIVDAAIWRGPGRVGMVAPNPGLVRHGATIHRADDIASLARRAGLPADELTHTVAAYNVAVASDALGALVPPRSQAKARAMPIAEPPFMAIPLCAGITNTMGGLLVDGDARVLGANAQPIDGLYAAGAVTGGLEGGPRVDYVGGLLKAAVFGLRAAEHAAGEIASSSQPDVVKETSP